jgi:hypothetical protein
LKAVRPLFFPESDGRLDGAMVGLGSLFAPLQRMGLEFAEGVSIQDPER